MGLLHRLTLKVKYLKYMKTAVFFISETRVLKDDDFPLVERVILGPLEDVAKLFIMDKDKVKEVNEEVGFEILIIN